MQATVGSSLCYCDRRNCSLNRKTLLRSKPAVPVSRILLRGGWSGPPSTNRQMRLFCAQAVQTVNPFKFTSLTEMDCYSMANVRPSTTGLDMTIFISTSLGVHHKFGPHIKVATLYGPKVPSDASFFSITVEEEPRVIGDTGQIKNADVKKAVEFVKLNQESLLAVWKQDLGVPEIVWQRIT